MARRLLSCLIFVSLYDTRVNYNTMKKEMQKLICLISAIIFVSNMAAYNLTTINSLQGLSNSSITHIYKDSHNVMWFCTYDGLNAYYGDVIKIYKPSQKGNCITGNVVRKVIETDNNVYWIHTNMGLDKLDKKKNHIKNYNRKQHNNLIVNSQKQLFTICTHDSIAMYNFQNDRLIQYYLGKINLYAINHVSFDSNDILWITTTDGKIFNCKITTNETEIIKVEHLQVQISKFVNNIRHVFAEKDILYIVDNNNILNSYNRKTKECVSLKDLSPIMTKGYPISIASWGKDIFVGFDTGLYKLNYADHNSYEIEHINVNCGIFHIYSDYEHNTAWIGTDGFGVIMYSESKYTFKEHIFDEIKKPIRSIFKDRYDQIWLGTKGDGLLQSNINQLKKAPPLPANRHYTKFNSLLTNNSIYAFCESRRDLFWIGGDGPTLNYYSYNTQKIHALENKTNKNIRFVHSIYEESDTILWTATSGNGIQKIKLSESNGHLYITDVNIYNFYTERNNYYSFILENDSTIWTGSRGNGLVKFNPQNEKNRKFYFDKSEELLQNDIICIYKDKKGTIWLGSSLGLIKIIAFNGHETEYKSYTEEDGLINNYIHGILEDDNNRLWLSTNNGLVEFDPERETFSVFNQNNDKKIIEFADNATYKDELNGDLYFGAINGITQIVFNNIKNKQYDPEIQLLGIKFFGDDANIYNFLNEEENQLTLPAGSNIFTISFYIPDYLKQGTYTYHYKLDNLNQQWINNNFSSNFSFTNIPHGKYTLFINYRKNEDDSKNNYYSLEIEILPPWYQSTLAYICYIIILTSSIIFIVSLTKRWYYMKKSNIINKIQIRQKEEIYESKLRFFINITHELSTPLTLIQGPCDKIMNYENSDIYINKYANLISRNTKRLNKLLQEIIEFRRFETGSYNLVIKETAITPLIQDVIEVFNHLAESRNISYNSLIEENIIWNSDESCITKIAYNLISNAIRYTPDNGIITIKMYCKDEGLLFSVCNTGKGIKEEKIPFIFNRYKILDDFEDRTGEGNITRNGLGLAICHNMVNLLQGRIEVNSELNKETIFTVYLPKLTADSVSNETKSIVTNKKEYHIPDEEKLNILNKPYKENAYTLLVLEDDYDLLWFIGDVLSEKYNIIYQNQPQEALEYIENSPPNLIITDLSLPDMNGIEFTKKIKQNKLLSYIPILILFAGNEAEIQIEAIEAGAEHYISKPFDVEYLEHVVAKLIQRKEDLKEYYNSIFSSHIIHNGHIIHKEDKEFFNNFLQIINKNISNPDLSMEFIGESLGYSSRHLYRKLKNITDKTPNNIIKEYRLSVVENLLITTNLSIEEIIYKSGFNNKSNFYKVFTSVYGVTPKSFRIMKKKELENESD